MLIKFVLIAPVPYLCPMNPHPLLHHCQFLSLLPATLATSTPVSEAAFITFISHSSFHLALGITVRFSISVEILLPPPTDTVHFIFQILQTFVIIHFLLLCVHSINVIYGADFVQKVSRIVRFGAKIALLDSWGGNCTERITMFLVVPKSKSI